MSSSELRLWVVVLICMQLFYLLVFSWVSIQQMSIYSGFATRSLEQYYDKMLYNLISTLLLRLTKFYQREQVDQNTFLKIIFEQEKSFRKIEKRKYLDPKYSPLLTTFKNTLSTDPSPPIQTHRTDLKLQKSRNKDNHDLNRTLSLLGKQFGELRFHAEKLDRFQPGELSEEESIPNLAKIEQRKKHTSKRKKNHKKTSIKSNLDIWDFRHEKPPELPSLHPVHTLQRTIMAKTKFNNFSQRQESKQVQVQQQEGHSLRQVLSKQPRFKAKMFLK